MEGHIIFIKSINIIYILKYIVILDDFVILLDNYDFFNFFVNVCCHLLYQLRIN